MICHITASQGEEISTFLLISLSWEAVESQEFSPQSPFLHTEKVKVLRLSSQVHLPALSSALLPSSRCITTQTQCPSEMVGPRTAHSTPGEVTPMLNTIKG